MADGTGGTALAMPQRLYLTCRPVPCAAVTPIICRGSSEIAGPDLPQSLAARYGRQTPGSDTEQTAPQKPESQSSNAYFLYLPLR